MRVFPRARTWAALACVLSSSCLFPDYTFTESAGGGGSTSTSNASTTSVSSATAMTSSSTGIVIVEDCFNGTDDDDDGLADCEDPDCDADTECVDPIPVGWGTFGFVVIGEGNPNAPPMCPAFASMSKYTGLTDLECNSGTCDMSSFSCSNCVCGMATGQACSITADLNPGAAGIQAFQVRDVPCNNPNATTIGELSIPAAWNLACNVAETAPGGQTCPGGACNQSVFTGFPTVSGGMCGHTGGALSKTDPEWQTASVACGGLALAGCTGGQKCMPKPQAPLLGSVCIGKAGDQVCPSPFMKKHLYYTDFTDSRSCEACDCNAPTGGSCTVTLTLNSDGACGNNVVAFNAGTCTNLVGNPTISGREGTVSVAPHGANCSPVKLMPTKNGLAAPNTTTATTFCCL